MYMSGLLTATVLFAMASVGSANAAVIYSNEPSGFSIGNCSFSTTCAATAGAGNDFAAQAFSLASAATITAGSFEELDKNTSSTSVNYRFYAGVAGLPGGPALFSGSSAITATSEGSDVNYNHGLESFSIASVTLGPGNYFFAFQAVSPVFETYLAEGLVNIGAAETHNGGATWSASYAGFGGVAVALFSDATAVPEPLTVSLFGVGLAGAVATRRRRKEMQEA
ncbi:MAG: PEP-CTERM sorting domain-containing protein [Alphaproteobacteria bacterium]|nr:PEP-CTERM sorting domain-containing protein [Alphaproteobacteria bacterium]